MSLNYNIIETFKLLSNAFKYNVFISIIISSILFIIVLIMNKDKKIFNYIILVINILLIIFISYYYIKSIITFKFSNPINNMYFYFFNSIVYLIIMSISILKTKYKKTNYIFYGMVLINLLYALFMTHYLNNIEIIVIGNIFPMIKLGNIIYLVYYIFIVIVIIKYIKKSILTKKI